MKHFLLKFNHGVEIGAYLAYIGHVNRTGSVHILKIAQEEMDHMLVLESILEEFNDAPNPIIDFVFRLIGTGVYLACQFMPLFTLNWVARTMEMFAVFNYLKLASKYPEKATVFKSMALAESLHEEYFRLGPVRFENLQNLRKSLVGGVL